MTVTTSQSGTLLALKALHASIEPLWGFVLFFVLYISKGTTNTILNTILKPLSIRSSL